jgi:hypothetical protein
MGNYFSEQGFSSWRMHIFSIEENGDLDFRDEFKIFVLDSTRSKCVTLILHL